MSWSDKLCVLVKESFDFEVFNSTFALSDKERQALLDLSDRFCWPLLCYSEFTSKVSRVCFSKKQYEDDCHLAQVRYCTACA